MALMGKATIKPRWHDGPCARHDRGLSDLLKLEPNGKHAAEAQASIDALSGKANMEYKKNKK